MNAKQILGSRGFVLMFTLLMVALIILIIVTFSVIPYNELTAAENTANAIRAYHIAEAGIAKKFMDLRSTGSTSPLSENFTIVSGSTGTYSVTVSTVQGGAFPAYRLTSTGTYKNRQRQVSYTLKQVSCARFAYLSNDEDMMAWGGPQPIWFISGDIIRGPLHTNDTLNISGDPIFEGPVSSCGTSINFYHGGPPNDNPDFRQSLTLGAPVVQLPAAAEIINGISAQAQQTDGLYLTGNSVITLLPNGTMNVTNTAKGWYTPHNVPNPPNGSVFVSNGYVDVSGVLSGQLTIGTTNSIYVVNNLLYSNDPRINPSSSDMLGLVAQNNVYVDKDAPYDVEIDAYIVALNTSFGVENYYSTLKGTLTLYGGLTQYRRGPVGTFNGATGMKVSGYTKNYNYDARFQDTAPPYFPPARDANGRILYVKTLYSES